MIDRRQLAEALGRLDPRDREVLDYSMRRHVPDNDLAAVFDCGPSDVARMRAAAVERLADDLGVQRGSDLGSVLTALLDHSTWDLVPAAEPPTAALPADVTPVVETPAVAAKPEPEPAAHGPVAPTTPASTPVLGMLAGDDARERRAGAVDKATFASGRRWPIAAAILIALFVAVGISSVVLLGDDAGSSTLADDESGTRPFLPHREAIGEPFPSDPESAYRYPIATIERPVTLMDEPDGKPKIRVAAKTEWDSPRVLSIVQREGRWLSVLVPELDNGEVGWIHETQVAELDTLGFALRADLAKRELKVERDGEIIKTIRVGIGRVDHPTPPGRYAVTDKLRVSDPGSPYGCCVVALTGHQTRLPEGWPGGDRLAIHATDDTSGIGQAVSLGCLRVDAKDAKWLLEALPLGTPVFISEGEPKRSATSQRDRSRR